MRTVLLAVLLFPLFAFAQEPTKPAAQDDTRKPYMLTDAEAQTVAQALLRPACSSEVLWQTLNAQFQQSHPTVAPAADKKAKP